MLHELLNALEETLFMVFSSGLLTLLLGLPLGILLAITHPNQSLANSTLANSWLHKSLSALIHVCCSIPYVILMIALIPFTKNLYSSISSSDNHCIFALIPLTLATLPLFAHLCGKAISDIPSTLTEVFISMGATPKQILFKVLLPESFANIMQNFLTTLNHLVGYSVIAGVLGCGGLGQLILEKASVFQFSGFLVIACSLIAIVLLIQRIGGYLIGVRN